MRFDSFFQRQHVVDVDAAVVGVSRLRWETINPDRAENPEMVRAFMHEKQFDLLPICTGSDSDEVREYYRTTSWGCFESVGRHSIDSTDIIPQRTPLEEVIRGFAIEDRTFYFLSSYGRITGLITIVNLNCRQAQVFMYGLLNELEVAFGRLVKEKIELGNINQVNLIKHLSKAGREAYMRDREKGVDAEVLEYFYLGDLLTVLRLDKKVRDQIGCSSLTDFDKKFNRLVKLRNTVAHPGRSLVSGPERVRKLWRDICLIESALSRLGLETDAPRTPGSGLSARSDDET
jgi:hypothetical protein